MSETWTIQNKPDYPQTYRFIMRGNETVAMTMSQKLAETIVSDHARVEALEREVARLTQAIEDIASWHHRRHPAYQIRDEDWALCHLLACRVAQNTAASPRAGDGGAEGVGG